MNICEQTQILRSNLLGMARVTQKSVDYAIKAYEQGNSDFCVSVRGCACEIDVLYRQTTALVRDLLASEFLGESVLRYILASDRIANAMRVVYGQAVEIAMNSGRIVENGGGLGCMELTNMGDLTNSLMRLSVVALFEKNVEHAELVQHSSGVDRLFGSLFYDWYRTLNHAGRAQAEFERAITKHLAHIALQTHEVAGAIVFWLDDSVALAAAVECSSHITNSAVSKAQPHGLWTFEGSDQLSVDFPALVNLIDGEDRDDDMCINRKLNSVQTPRAHR